MGEAPHFAGANPSEYRHLPDAPQAPYVSLQAGSTVDLLDIEPVQPFLTVNLSLKEGSIASPIEGSCSLPPSMSTDHDTTFVDRVSRQGEEALGKLAEELIASPVVSGAVSRVFEAREKAVQAQEAALGALNIPSAADVERVTRRLRSVSQRLESIEDTLDRLEERLATPPAPKKPAPRKSPARKKPAAKRPAAKKS